MTTHQTPEQSEARLFKPEDLARAEAILRAQNLLGDLLGDFTFGQQEPAVEEPIVEQPQIPAPAAEVTSTPPKTPSRSKELPLLRQPLRERSPHKDVPDFKRSGPNESRRGAPLRSGMTYELRLDVDKDEPEDWQSRALCAQTDPEAFFPEKGGSTKEAKRVCMSCEVREECLDAALERDERFGIWGGLSERERRKIKRQVIAEVHVAPDQRINQLLDTLDDGQEADTIDSVRLALEADSELVPTFVATVMDVYVQHSDTKVNARMTERMTRYFSGEDLDFLTAEHNAASAWLQQGIKHLGETMDKVLDAEGSPIAECYGIWVASLAKTETA